jgi:hypothetical protein
MYAQLKVSIRSRLVSAHFAEGYLVQTRVAGPGPCSHSVLYYVLL